MGKTEGYVVKKEWLFYQPFEENGFQDERCQCGAFLFNLTIYVKALSLHHECLTSRFTFGEGVIQRSVQEDLQQTTGFERTGDSFFVIQPEPNGSMIELHGIICSDSI